MMLCALMLACTRLGSLNALGRSRGNSLWKRYGVVGRLPSADQLGRVAALVQPREVRRQLRRVYRKLKRQKALRPAGHGNLFSLIIDGHECSASYLRCCSQCQKRRINKGTTKERIQHYHRLVMAVLACERFTLLLDVELQRPGEDEVRAALRLLERVLADYPRAFDLVVADGLYAQSPFFRKVRAAGKEAIAVLKQEDRDLSVDMLSLCKRLKPQSHDTPTCKREVWDVEQLNSWPQVGSSVRVVRSRETTTVKRHSGVLQKRTTHWMWVTTIPRSRLPTRQFLDVAHGRWKIENDAFNELVNRWHVDHLYKHDTNAILFFWLLTMLAYNLFHAFFFLNIKPTLRNRLQKYQTADFITAELHVANSKALVRGP